MPERGVLSVCTRGLCDSHVRTCHDSSTMQHGDSGCRYHTLALSVSHRAPNYAIAQRMQDTKVRKGSVVVKDQNALGTIFRNHSRQSVVETEVCMLPKCSMPHLRHLPVWSTASTTVTELRTIAGCCTHTHTHTHLVTHTHTHTHHL